MAAEDAVLYVEDDDNDRKIMEIAFGRMGLPLRLVQVKDGEEAMDYLEGRDAYADRQRWPAPAVIIMDLKMPRRSGFEVLEWMRGRGELKQLPVVVFTSSDYETDRERALALGVRGYFTKGLGIAQLMKTIDRMLSTAGMSVPAARAARAEQGNVRA